MSPRSRLLVVEMVLPSGDEPHPGKMLDLAMVTLTTGRERTAQEYEVLLARAGLRLREVVPTGSAVSVLEAVGDRLAPGSDESAPTRPTRLDNRSHQLQASPFSEV